MNRIMPFFVLAASALAQDGAAPAPRLVIRMSPILNAVDTNQDGTLSAAEIADAVAQIRKLDKNGDGKLTRDEGGMRMQPGGGRPMRPPGEEEIPPIPPPTAEELTATFMMFDANKNGQLEKKEVPERMRGLFERGDTNNDGVLTRAEIVVLAEANRQQAGGRGPGGPGGPGGRGRGGGPPDPAWNALDTDHDGEISAAEINNAVASLKTLDKNGDGQITEDEVALPAGGRAPAGRGPGGQ